MTERPARPADQPTEDPVGDTADPAAQAAQQSAQQSALLSHSAVMAAGTTVSRLTGFVRAALLSYALGASLHSDIFAFGNTVPNALYILLAGGIFNAVLVPQLVRALRHDPDRGDAYTNRVITVAGLFLVVATALLVLAAPLIVDVATTGYDGAVRDSAIAFTRLCMPQVFFYGMYVLVGQILNARGSFGPMMWAPIANNVISVAVLIVYIGVFGQAEGNEVFGAYTSGQELLLGLGATLGIAVQLLVLVPYLRRSGFHYRPRFDLRGSGLGHTLRLGLWTVLFVVVNQIAYVVVQKLATSGTSSSTDGTGVTVYSFSFLVVMVPHSIVTVSLATAMMTTISAQADAHDRPAMARTLSSTLRAALAIIVPFVALLPVIAPDLARVLFAHGAAADVGVDAYTPTLSLFGLGILFFTIHYLVLRGFYALEQNRLVFFVQCGVAAVNIAVGIALVGATSAKNTAPALVVSYAAAYAVGATVSYLLLRHRLRGLYTRRLLSFGGRLIIATGLATALTFPIAQVLDGLSEDPSTLVAAVRLVCVGAVDVLFFLIFARLLRITEVSAVLATLTRRART
ncbi:MAG TPA: murein biosynthesis integral membrane protein MurJ [Nocardioides sp.]|uniref:murein biosynthesis integral membrane protein MurJ n=1 Tax=uncultured Nocardioides sp. TaxID=198441 RepID=UPI002627EE6E|nr:murein biosynthesis integral membrane protein MurJ [uncultured Nocardioides sp.]HRI98236.1 murein biosynthesis integral membrane protein MurJ [Nocardioides sp.]HRK47806.1 murein biosynthesis integral membrane protein MurJ [Nocardioides sp.]